MFDHGDNLSPAVRRVVETAQRAAIDAGRDVLPADLLQALLNDEGHATELLRQMGVLPLSMGAADSPAAGAALSLPRLLRAARQLVRSGEELSSLHLLAALGQADQTTGSHLESFGLSVQQLEQRLDGGTDSSTEPLSTDVRIAPVVPAADDLSACLRILDAAANRGREGLRVLEDHARFVLEDAHLTSRLKEVRHSLAQLVSALVGDRGWRQRDTSRDVGTGVHTRFETQRLSDRDVVRANAARTQEALRTLEEYGKRLDPLTAVRLGELRYQSYVLEQALLVSESARHRLAGITLCLLVTDSLCPRGSGPVVKAALAGGCRMIQLREKNIPDQQLLLRARLLRKWTREAGALLIINDRPDLAVLVDADGVHVGQEDLSPANARRIVGGDRLVGVSTHNIAQIRQAVLDGADYLGIGPVFASATKSFDALAGLEFVHAAAAETSLPWFAIGGVNAQNIEAIVAAGGRRVALSSAVCQADDPAEATRALLRELEPSAGTIRSTDSE